MGPDNSLQKRKRKRESNGPSPSSTASMKPPEKPILPPQPILSAVAARRAAKAAQESQAPQDQETERKLDLDDVNGDSEGMMDMDMDGEDGEDGSVQAWEPNQPKSYRRKERKSTRYFAGQENTTGMDVVNSGEAFGGGALDGADEMDSAGSELEPDNDIEVNRGGDSSADRERPTPRRPRRDRFKAPFFDPNCQSSFAPQAGHNIAFVRNAQLQNKGIILGLMNGETAICHGVYSLTVLSGAVEISGSIRTSSDPAIPIYAPSTHPLPPIMAIGRGPVSVGAPHLAPKLESTNPSPSSPEITSYWPRFPDFSSDKGGAIIVLRTLRTGVEGVEELMRLGGMIGKGDEVWPRPSQSGGGADGQGWAEEGFRLVTSPSPELEALRLPSSWSSALDLIAPYRTLADGNEEEDDRFVAIIEGRKRVGKSTFSKMAMNRLLTKYEKVAYLDCDLGQSEFGPSGMVSLNVFKQPIIGPPMTHPTIPFRAHFIGSTTPKTEPARYLSAIADLLEVYRLYIEFPNDDLDHSYKSSKVWDRVPLVINTQGWVKGLGEDLAGSLKEVAKPSHIFSFLAPPEVADELALTENPRIIPLSTIPESQLSLRLTAADTRSINLLSYFHAEFTVPSSVEGSETSLCSRWKFSVPLLRQLPYRIPWSPGEGGPIDSIYMAGSGAAVDKRHVLSALNGSLVALVADLSPKEPCVTFPYEPSCPLPLPESSTCLGLALIRSIDPSRRTFQLLCPLPASHLETAGVSTLVKGDIDLPTLAMLDYAETGVIGMDPEGICDVRWKDVPYLTRDGIGEGGVAGSGRRKVRRNLMRRSQMGA